MHEQYFGLSEKPFSIQPDPDFIYWSPNHEMAFAMLEYGIMNQAGFTVITGEVGCGKTTLLRQLLRKVDDKVTVGMMSHTMLGSGRLLEWALMSLKQPFDSPSYVELYRQLEQFLTDELGRGKRTVLIIDESQNLDMAALEELRMLSNMNVDKHQLLQLILVGQPQLRDQLQHPTLVQFAQRVASDFHLGPLEKDHVAEYIHHRMKHAGATDSVFTPHAIDMIASASRGVPRTINILCDTALVYAFSKEVKGVNIEIIRDVLEDKRKHGIFPKKASPKVVSKRAKKSAS